MNTKFKYSIVSLAILAPVTDLAAHVDGEHTGGLLQSLLHILQSPQHLVVMLITAVTVSLLVRSALSKRK